MDLRIQLSATVGEAGQLMWSEPVRYKAWAAVARGRHVTVTLERLRLRRSTVANARYWACLVPFAAEIFEQRTGQPFTKDMAHYALKLAFLGHQTVIVAGVEVLVPKSTADLPVGEFNDYTQRIEAWIWQEFKVNPELIEAEA